MNLTLVGGLPFASATLTYQSQTITLNHVLIDTGSGGTVFAADQLSNIGVVPEPQDPLRRIAGVGGAEYVFEKTIDHLAVGDLRIGSFPILESGGMSEKGMNFAAAVEALRDFVASRRAAAQQIIDTPPAWTEPLQERNCSGAEGSFKATGSFATTYGSLGSTDPFAVGSGSIELAEDGKGVSVVTVGAQAGADEKTPDRTLVNVIAQQNDGSHRTASFSISNAAFVAGATITFDKSGDLAGVLTGEVPNVKTWVVGALSSGSITLTKAGTDEGQAVEGTFAASWGDAGDK